MTRRVRLVVLCTALSLVACGHSGSDLAGESTRKSLLLYLPGGPEARVIAVIGPTAWTDPYLADKQVVADTIAQSKMFHTLTRPDQPSTGRIAGVLSDRVRWECGDLYVHLADSSEAQGFAVAGQDRGLQPRPGKPTTVTAEQENAVRELLARRGVKIDRPHIEQAYEIDLQGSGSPEIVLQVTDPELDTDFEDYKSSYYSVIVVLPGRQNRQPAVAGYIQASQGAVGFEVLRLEAAADFQGDGRMELVVRARNNEGWQTQIFQYIDDLKLVFQTTSGERDCKETGGAPASQHE